MHACISVCIYVYRYVCVCMCMHAQPLKSCQICFAMPWTVAHQAPLSMKFSRQEYWSGLPFSPSGDLPRPGIEPVVPVACIGLAGRFFTTEPPRNCCVYIYTHINIISVLYTIYWVYICLSTCCCC